MNENSTGRLIALNSLQISLLKEGERAQEATDNYITELRRRIKGLEDRSEALQKEAKNINRDADELRNLSNTFLSKANKKYEQILGSILASLNVKMPCRSELRSDENGNLSSIFVYELADDAPNP